ncbi:MAG: 4'-phosphopantetheinyl transferase superfamily protein [Rikenellaceae bacterium]|nr:4'-phosphopantetheinyl transferase superfamily protein [Rikenellaceae bacterium]
MRIELPHNNYGYIVVEQVCPQADQSPLLTDSDLQYLATLNSPARRAQWATWRTIVRRELGPDALLCYNSAGAPYLERPVGRVSHLSVSHSTTYVAVMFAEGRCGVDIESVERNFGRIAARYISPTEREALAEAAGPHFEAIMWSAKEAVYKYGQATGVEFTEEMIATAIEPTEQTIAIELYGVPQPTLHYAFVDDQVLAYIVALNAANK